MSDLNRREAMKRATAAAVAASAGTQMAGTARADDYQQPAGEGQPGIRAPDKRWPTTTSDHVPISIFIRAKQQIQLTGRGIAPGAPSWSAKADDPSVAQVTVEPVHIGHFPVEFWNLTVTGLKIGKTHVHVQEAQATHPPHVLYHFVLDVTVLGLLQ
jgi:hypothetical protein